MRFSLAATAALLVGCFNPRIQNGGFACNGSDSSACPSGYSCVAQRCVMVSGGSGGGMGGLSVAKTGSYNGLTLDPMLAATTDCPDEPLEPNDGPGAAPFGPPILVDAQPDQVTPRVQHMAICPKGNNPATGQHDADWFKVPVSSPVTLVAQAFYDVAYGDLDLAIVDAAGNVVASDGTSVSNACASASVQNGTFYVVVVGAENAAVNRYELLVRAYSTGGSCAMGGGDMGVPRD